MEEEDLEHLRDYRNNKFYTNVEKLRHQFLYDDELILRVSHNGSQESSISLTPKEAKKVIKVLTMYLKSIK